MPQQKRECQRLQDDYMAETKQLYKPSHPSKQMRQNPNQQFEGSEDYDYVVDRKTGWKWYKGQQGNLCRILRLRHPHHGRIPHGKVGIPGGGILQSSDERAMKNWDFFDFSVSACRIVGFRIAGTQYRQVDGWVYTEYNTHSVHDVHHSLFHKHARITECVLVAQGSSCSCINYACAYKRIRHQVSHVSFLLVSASTLSHLSTSTTARSTTWTARTSARRHCTP